MLSSKPAPDGDEEKDEGGFGASVAMSESRFVRLPVVSIGILMCACTVKTRTGYTRSLELE